jgi:peptide/nickel transport system substrate-binding protein
MRTSKRFASAVVLGTGFVISLMLLCMHSVFAAESKPAYGGTLRIGEWMSGLSIGYPAKLPSFRQVGVREAAPAVEPLLRFDKAGRLVPWLATTFKEDPKNKAITLTLKKGVKFHDGTDFNADAVKWNLEQHMSLKTAPVRVFKSIDVIDNYTLRINLIEWDSTILGNLAMITGLMISPTAYKKNGEEWCANNPVGTGPFQFVSRQQDVRTLYRKFPGYWQKGKPYLDAIEFLFTADHLTREMSLKTGESDIANALMRKNWALLEKDGYMINRVMVGSSVFLLVPDSLNPQSPFANVKVRQAASHAIDAAAIAKTVFYGEAEGSNQVMYKTHWGYNPSVVGYPYNPAKAKQLLIEAGYPNGFKTKLTYITSAENDIIFTALQGYLRAVGIDADLDPIQMGRYDQVALRGGKWEGVIYASQSPSLDAAATLRDLFTGGSNFSQMLVPDDYAREVQKAIAATNSQIKQKRVHGAVKLMIDKHCLVIPVWKAVSASVFQKYVKNNSQYTTPYEGQWVPEEMYLQR